VTTMSAPTAEQRPVALLAGLFAGFASIILTLGYLWPVAPLFPAMLAAIAFVLPFKNHGLVARGAAYACLGILVFEVVFVPFLLLS